MGQTIDSNIVAITPNPQDLIKTTQLTCTVDGCQSIFKNRGNLQMHLEKHHRISASLTKDTHSKLFFCPQPNCIYHEATKKRKHFKCLKYLRQHFLKVHAEKVYTCSKCNKGFATESMLNAHSKTCGTVYTCNECSWSYDTSEALLTHAKRKGHKVKRKEEPSTAEKVAIPRLQKNLIIIVPEPMDRHTQTDNDHVLMTLPPKKRVKIATTPDVDHQFHEPPLCDIETQTEFNLTSATYDPMLYSHTYTQTCDELLTELGLANIQTQTNCSEIDEEESMRENRKQEFSEGGHDESRKRFQWEFPSDSHADMIARYELLSD